MARHWRSLFFVPLFIVGCSILGGILGPGMEGVSAATSSPEDELKSSIGALDLSLTPDESRWLNLETA